MYFSLLFALHCRALCTFGASRARSYNRTRRREPTVRMRTVGAHFSSLLLFVPSSVLFSMFQFEKLALPSFRFAFLSAAYIQLMLDGYFESLASGSITKKRPRQKLTFALIEIQEGSCRKRRRKRKREPGNLVK